MIFELWDVKLLIIEKTADPLADDEFEIKTLGIYSMSCSCGAVYIGD